MDIRERVARAILAKMKADDPGIYVRDAEELDTLVTVDGYVKFGNLADAALLASGYHEMREALETLIAKATAIDDEPDSGLGWARYYEALNAARAALGEDKT